MSAFNNLLREVVKYGQRVVAWVLRNKKRILDMLRRGRPYPLVLTWVLRSAGVK